VPGSDDGVDGPAEAEYRPLLFSIAYGMTGSAGDAEDIVQDAFLGLTRARKAGTTITDPKAYLATAVMRLGINYQKSARVRRETYVGDWLPEPIVVPVDGTGPAEHAELADSLSMAFLVLLETLSPVERAVFMLREVFGYGYPDVARITGKTEANCRQIFSRARQRIGAGTRQRPVSGAAGGRRGTRPQVLRDRRRRRHGPAARHARPRRGVLRGRRRQGAGDRRAAARAAAGRPAAGRSVPPGPVPRHVPPAGLGQRPAGRGRVRRRGAGVHRVRA
jgi:RNA polymerase sigma factor (sigma-70 family)